jgi:hypothetical protein
VPYLQAVSMIFSISAISGGPSGGGGDVSVFACSPLSVSIFSCKPPGVISQPSKAAALRVSLFGQLP